MQSSVRHVLLPALGLALLLGVSVYVTLSAGGTPAAALHGRVLSYLRALQGGDVASLAALRADGDPRPEAERLRLLRGRAFFVVRQRIVEEGRAGEVVVAWLDGQGRSARVSQQLWGRAADGIWRFEGLGAPVSALNR